MAAGVGRRQVDVHGHNHGGAGQVVRDLESGGRERAFASHTEGDRSTVPLSVTLCKPHPSSGARLDEIR